MKFFGREKLNGFLFSENNRLLPRILLSIYLVLATYGTFLIYINPPKYLEENSNSSISSEDDNINSDESSLDDLSSSSVKKSSKTGSSSSSGEEDDTSGSYQPGDESDTATLVAFYSDSQSDTDEEDQIHQRVVNHILATSANPVFHAGDLLEDGTVESRDRFNAVTTTLRATRTFYAAQGNNERNSSVYFDNFTFPGNEHYYSVNFGNLHMVILDNYALPVSVGSAQYNWLISDLQSSASQSRITGVIFHYPIYGSGGDWKGMIGSMVPLFRNYGVDFVISGHEHFYQKSQIDSVWYFVTSGQPSLGYFLGYIYPNRVTIKVYNNANGLVDTVSFNER